MLELFRTPRNLPMLNFQRTESGALSLHCDQFPVSEPPITYTWTTIDTTWLNERYSLGARRVLAVNAIRSRIATQTRRACGNILIVPDHDTQMWYEHTDLPWQKPDAIVIDRSLASNEIRSTYFRIMYHDDKPIAVDGGMQVTPDGTVMLPNANAYFARGFL